MDQEINSENYSKIIEIATEFRFRAIEASINLETFISEVLIEYLGDEDTKEILRKHLFSDATTFDRKVSIFCALHKKKLFSAIKEDSFIGEDLDVIKYLRNFMAHANLDTRKESINNFDNESVKFVSFKERGVREITLKLYSKEDSMKDNLFSYNALMLRYNRTSASLQKLAKYLYSK